MPGAGRICDDLGQIQNRNGGTRGDGRADVIRFRHRDGEFAAWLSQRVLQIRVLGVECLRPGIDRCTGCGTVAPVDRHGLMVVNAGVGIGADQRDDGAFLELRQRRRSQCAATGGCEKLEPVRAGNRRRHVVDAYGNRSAGRAAGSVQVGRVGGDPKRPGCRVVVTVDVPHVGEREVAGRQAHCLGLGAIAPVDGDEVRRRRRGR